MTVAAIMVSTAAASASGSFRFIPKRNDSTSFDAANEARAASAFRREKATSARGYADARSGASSPRRRPSAFERICETLDSLMPSTSAMSADLSSSK